MILAPTMVAILTLCISTSSYADGEKCDKGVNFNNGASYQSVTGEVTCHYDGGGIARKATLSNGDIVAESRYNEQGILFIQQQLKGGRRNGLVREFYPDTGKLKSQQNYENDQPVGVGTSYYPDGKTVASLRYEESSTQSPSSVSFNPSGQPTSVECNAKFPPELANYCGKAVQLYSDTGEKTSVFVARESGFTGKVANADGTQTAYKDGRLSGPEKIMGKNGHVARINNYEGGERVGEQIEYFDDSDQIETRYFIDPTSRKRTKSEAFFQNGQLATRKESLAADRYRIQVFFDDGKPSMEATLIENGKCDDFYGYCSDRPVGESKLYNRDGELLVSTHDEKGNIVKSVKYDASGKELETKQYYPDGSVKR